MATSQLVTTRASDFYRLIDAKDEERLRGLFSEDAQNVDEITRGWLRGRPAVLALIADQLPRITDIHSTIEGTEVRRWGDTEVETLLLRQSYVYDGTRYEIEAPTTMIWRREGADWKVALAQRPSPRRVGRGLQHPCPCVQWRGHRPLRGAGRLNRRAARLGRVDRGSGRGPPSTSLRLRPWPAPTSGGARPHSR